MLLVEYLCFAKLLLLDVRNVPKNLFFLRNVSLYLFLVHLRAFPNLKTLPVVRKAYEVETTGIEGSPGHSNGCCIGQSDLISSMNFANRGCYQLGRSNLLSK